MCSQVLYVLTALLSTVVFQRHFQRYEVAHTPPRLIVGEVNLWPNRATIPVLFPASMFRVLQSVFLFGIGLFKQVDIPPDRRGSPQTKARRRPPGFHCTNEPRYREQLHDGKLVCLKTQNPSLVETLRW